MPYTIPRSHTIHAPSDVTRRSVDHLPLAQSALVGDSLPHNNLEQHPLPQSVFGPQRRAKSEHGSPDSAPVSATDNFAAPVPPLDLTSFFPPPAAPASQQSLDQSNETESEQPKTVSDSGQFGKTLDPIVTSASSLDMSSFPFSASTTSPVTNMAFQDPYQESYFASPDTDVPLGSAGFNAPSVDWSSFPLYSDAPAATSTQAPSYASFDYNSMGPGFPAPSSSGDISEADEFGPLPGLTHSGSDLHDLHSVSEGSDMDHFRLSSASSFAGMPQAQLLASNHLESISIDDFLKSANESTAALEHQLQSNVAVEPKPLPESFNPEQPQTYNEENEENDKSAPESTANLVMPTPQTDSVWPPTMFESGSGIDDTFLPQSWAQ